MTKHTNEPQHQRSAALQTNVAVITNDIAYIKRSIDDINSKLEKDYVTRDEFEPVRNIVYGLVGLILVAIVGAIMTLLLRK